MADINPVDWCICCVSYCNGVKGDNIDPGCCKKTFLPMTSVIQAEGVDKCCPNIVSAYFLGCFYTLCCWNIGESNGVSTKSNGVSTNQYTPVSKVEHDTGYEKLRY